SGDNFAHIDRLDDECAFPRVCQQLLAQISGVQSGCLDAGQADSCRGISGKFSEGGFGVADNAGKQVVEIMSDAAGKQAEALEFLALLDAGVGGQVADNGSQAGLTLTRGLSV